MQTSRRRLLLAAAATGAIGVTASAPDAEAAAAPSTAQLDWINVTSAPYGAKGDGSTDDYAAITAAIAACPPGGVVYFPAGNYVVTNTLNVPANVTLRGTLGMRWFGYTAPGQPSAVYLRPLYGNFHGSSLVNLTGAGARLEDLTLQSGRADNSDTHGPVDGIKALGGIKAVRIANVGVDNFSGYGVHTDTTAGGFPGGWEVSHLAMEDNGLGGWRSDNSAVASGVTFSFGDSLIESSEAGKNGGDGWYWAGCGSMDFVGLRATWNAGNGFTINGNSGTVGFAECQTDRNTMNGWLLACPETAAKAPAPHVITLTGCQASRDGRNNDTVKGGYAGFAVQGTSTALHVPVALTGCSTHVAGDDVSGGILSPDYAVSVSNGRKVLLTGCVLNATVATVQDDNNRAAVDTGTSMHNLVDFTSGAVTYNAPSPAFTPVGNAPQPSDYGFKTWSFDPAVSSSSSTALVSGNVYLVRVEVHQAVAVSAICILLTSSGSGLGAGVNFAGLYNSQGQQVAVTADQSGNWASGAGSLKSMPLAGTVSLAPGFYWVSLLANGTTPPAFARGATFPVPGSFLNAALTPATYRVANVSGSATTLPGTFDPTKNANSTVQMFWVGLT